MHKTAEVVRVGTRRIKPTLLTNVIRTILPSEKLELNGYQHLMELEEVCRGPCHCVGGTPDWYGVARQCHTRGSKQLLCMDPSS